VNNQVPKVIYAIANLEAEDLGDSILKTFYDEAEAIDEKELIEQGLHKDFFRTSHLEVFTIELPWQD